MRGAFGAGCSEGLVGGSEGHVEGVARDRWNVEDVVRVHTHLVTRSEQLLDSGNQDSLTLRILRCTERDAREFESVDGGAPVEHLGLSDVAQLDRDLVRTAEFQVRRLRDLLLRNLLFARLRPNEIDDSDDRYESENGKQALVVHDRLLGLLALGKEQRYVYRIACILSFVKYLIEPPVEPFSGAQKALRVYEYGL